MNIWNMKYQGSIALVPLVVVGNYSAMLYKLSWPPPYTRADIYMLVTELKADTGIKRFMFENV